MPAGSRRSEDPATPETWRVRFDLRIPPEPSQRRPAINSGPRIRDLGPPVLVPQVFANMAARARIRQLAAARFAASDPERERAKAMKLARRFEALRRALANPFPYARRLARKLHALARRAYAAAIRIARQIIPRWLGNPVVAQQADFQAWRAIHAFPDSS